MNKCIKCDKCIGNKGKGNDKWDRWEELCWDCENEKVECEKIEYQKGVERIISAVRIQMYIEKNPEAIEDVIDIDEEQQKKFIIKKYRFVD